MQVKVPHNLPFLTQLHLLGRPANAVLPALIMLTGYIIGGGSLYENDWRLFALVIAGFLVHGALTIANDLNDRDVDKDNGFQTIITRGSRHDIRRVWLSVAAMLVIGFGITIWLPLYVQISMWAMALLGIAYDFRPLMLSRRPVASIVVLGLIYGSLPFFVGYFMNAEMLTWQILLLALCWGVARASLSILKDFKDEKGDKKHGKKTFLLRYGARPTLLVSNVLAVVGLSGVAFTGLYFMSPVAWLPFVVTLAAVSWFIFSARRELLRAPARADDIFHQLLKVQIAFDAGVLAWVMLF